MYTDKQIDEMERHFDEMEERRRSAMTPKERAAEDAYYAEMQRRDDEGRPYPIDEMMECWECGHATPSDAKRDDMGNLYILRKCVALGPITEAHRDPTQTYELECGHTVI